MAFDADAFVAAMEPPTFTVGGRRFVGRILSVEEWITQMQRSAALDTSDLRAVRAYGHWCLTRWFPLPFWRRLLVPLLGHPAARAFAKLPDAAQMAALQDFSRSQRKAMPSSGATGHNAAGTTTDPDQPSDG